MTGIDFISAEVLGVDFRIPDPEPDWKDPIAEGMRRLHDTIYLDVREALHRQKRNFFCYVDGLTLMHSRRPMPMAKENEGVITLAMELAGCLAHGEVPDELLMRLMQFPALAELRSELQWQGGDEAPRRSHALARVPALAVVTDARGWTKLRGPVLYRRLSLGIEPIADPSAIDWWHLAALAVLAHVRCDAELFVDTGIWRTALCRRKACRSFFLVRQFSGRRPRFCSNACRASAAREQ